MTRLLLVAFWTVYGWALIVVGSLALGTFTALVDEFWPDAWGDE